MGIDFWPFAERNKTAARNKAFQKALEENMAVNRRLNEALKSMANPVVNRE